VNDWGGIMSPYLSYLKDNPKLTEELLGSYGSDLLSKIPMPKRGPWDTFAVDPGYTWNKDEEAELEEKGDDPMKWKEQWKVPSSSGKQHYTVSMAPDGTYACSCKAWSQRRIKCRHIRSVMRGEVLSSIYPSDEKIATSDVDFNRNSVAMPFDDVATEPVDRRTALEKLRDNAAWRL